MTRACGTFANDWMEGGRERGREGGKKEARKEGRKGQPTCSSKNLKALNASLLFKAEALEKHWWFYLAAEDTSGGSASVLNDTAQLLDCFELGFCPSNSPST